VETEKNFVMGNKIREDIIFLDMDHRQNSETYYRGPERRKGIERRSNIIFGNFERRQNDSSLYSGPERRSGIERRNAFA
jgi:hypothetical protein